MCHPFLCSPDRLLPLGYLARTLTTGTTLVAFFYQNMFLYYRSGSYAQACTYYGHRLWGEMVYPIRPQRSIWTSKAVTGDAFLLMLHTI